MAAITLFVAAMLSLLLGGFVQLDDTSGAGADDWVMPIGAVAFALSVVALVVAVRDRPQRRPLGAVLGATMVVIVALHAADDGFRFVWHSNEAELMLFEAVAAWIALALLATGGREKQAPPATVTLSRAFPRFVAYFGGTFLVLAVAFLAGVSHFEATECEGGGGECDLAAIGGLVFAAGALVLSVLTILVYEMWRAARRGRPQRSVVRY